MGTATHVVQTLTLAGGRPSITEEEYQPALLLLRMPNRLACKVRHRTELEVVLPLPGLLPDEPAAPTVDRPANDAPETIGGLPGGGRQATGGVIAAAAPAQGDSASGAAGAAAAAPPYRLEWLVPARVGAHPEDDSAAAAAALRSALSAVLLTERPVPQTTPAKLGEGGSGDRASGCVGCSSDGGRGRPLPAAACLVARLAYEPQRALGGAQVQLAVVRVGGGRWLYDVECSVGWRACMRAENAWEREDARRPYRLLRLTRLAQEPACQSAP